MGELPFHVPEDPLAIVPAWHHDPQSAIDVAQSPTSYDMERIRRIAEPTEELIAMLRRIVDDDKQPDDIRVQAVSRLADFGMPLVARYRDHGNEAIASELDLLDRLELYLAQQR